MRLEGFSQQPLLFACQPNGWVVPGFIRTVLLSNPEGVYMKREKMGLQPCWVGDFAQPRRSLVDADFKRTNEDLVRLCSTTPTRTSSSHDLKLAPIADQIISTPGGVIDGKPFAWTCAGEIASAIYIKHVIVSNTGDIVVANQREVHILREVTSGVWTKESICSMPFLITTMACLPDGSIAVGCMDNAIRLLTRRPESLKTWDSQIVMQCDTWSWSMAYFHDGRIVVGLIDTIAVCRKSLLSGAWKSEMIPQGHVGIVKSVACLPCGGIVSAATCERSARVWRRQPRSGTWQLEIELPTSNPVTSIVYLLNGFVVLGTSGPKIYIWRVKAYPRSWSLVATIPRQVDYDGSIVAFGLNAIAVPVEGNQLEIWHQGVSGNWICTDTLHSEKGAFSHVARHPNGRLITGFGYNSIHSWKFASKPGLVC